MVMGYGKSCENFKIDETNCKIAFFIYGTLKQKFEEYASKGMAKLVGEGYIFATLYDLKGYPGAFKGSGNKNRAYGIVYCISENFKDQIIKYCDEYEEFYPEKPESSLYIRECAKVILTDTNKTVSAFVYYYNGKPNGRIIDDGRWENRRFQ